MPVTPAMQARQDLEIAKRSYVLYLHEVGWKQVDIAKKLGVSRTRIHQQIQHAKRTNRQLAQSLVHMAASVCEVAKLTEGL